MRNAPLIALGGLAVVAAAVGLANKAGARAPAPSPHDVPPKPYLVVVWGPGNHVKQLRRATEVEARQTAALELAGTDAESAQVIHETTGATIFELRK